MAASSDDRRVVMDADKLDDFHINIYLDAAYDSLRRMAGKMLRAYPSVGRWDETDDVWQMAAMKFHGALQEVRPRSRTHFYRLAALQIRRVLVDLARKHNGSEGLNTNLDTAPLWAEEVHQMSDRTDDPVTIAEWAEFHEDVERLSEESKEVFDLVWYAELPASEAARLLGISERTLRRRWRNARLELSRLRDETAPG